jgi:hypothetical protein
MVDEAGEAQKGIPATRKVPLMAAAGAFRGLGGGARAHSAIAEAPAMMSFMAAPERSSMKGSGMLRSASPRSSDGAGAVWSSGEARKGASRSIFPEAPSAPAPMPRRMPSPAPAEPPASLGTPKAFDLRTEAARVDWDTVAAAADASGLDALTPAVRLAVLRASELPEVTVLAMSLGKAVRLVALGLLAMAARDSRPAARLARRLLAGADETKLKEARAALGL